MVCPGHPGIKPIKTSHMGHTKPGNFALFQTLNATIFKENAIIFHSKIYQRIARKMYVLL